MTDINLLDIYLTGMQVEETDKEVAEQGKVGNLRAGNSAILTSDGQILGKCARKTWLRKLGVKSDTHDFDRLLMFSAGYASEDIWYDRISKGWPGKILREEETPISWETSNGTKVTGRPDMVLCEELDVVMAEGPAKETKTEEYWEIEIPTVSTYEPKLVLEMKNVSSVWTARSVLFEEVPKFDHLCQAGHYSWKLGVPAKLCYSLYLDMAVDGNGWMGKHFPQKGEKYSEYCEYSDDRKRDGRPGKIKKVKPFLVIYDLRWTPTGQLLYRKEGSKGPDSWRISPVTRDGIERYYEMVSKLSEDDKELPPRPRTVKGDGSVENWTQCGYCPLKETCDRHEGSVNKWINAVKDMRWDDE